MDKLIKLGIIGMLALVLGACSTKDTIDYDNLKLDLGEVEDYDETDDGGF